MCSTRPWCVALSPPCKHALTRGVWLPRPQVMNTNAPERSGEAPLLERFILRYYIYEGRSVPHALVMGAPPLPVEVKQGIRREFVVARMLGLVASTLQANGIISFPCKLVFKSYYERFLKELRDNPWIDCDPPTSGDRRSSIMENLYCSLVNRMALHRLFLEPGAKHAGEPFAVEQLLDMEAEMATGDMQSAILALGAYSHSFRSPTEYRVAQLLSSLVITRLTREFREASRNSENAADKAHFDKGPCDAGAWSYKQVAILDELCGNNESDEKDRYKGPKWADGAAFRQALGSRYIPVTEFAWGAGTPSKWELCGTLANVLLEGQSGSTNKVMPEHAQKRIHLLSTTGARCGDDSGFPAIYLHSDTPRRRTTVLMLDSWHKDTVIDHTYSMHSMLQRAAMACSFTAPGTYVTLEPYAFSRFKKDSELVVDKDGKPARGSMHKLLPYFVVPVHGAACPLRDEDEERDPEQTVPLHLSGCSCFRHTRVPAQMGIEEVYLDPQLAAVQRFRDQHKVRASLPPPCAHAPMTYPADALDNALRKPSAARGKAREPSEAERALQEEYLSLLRETSQFTIEEVV